MQKQMMKFFNYMEKRAIKKHNWTFVPGSEYNCVYVDTMRYKGKDIQLYDGTVIRDGDLIAEAHINSKEMHDKDVRMVMKILNSEFKAFGYALRDHEDFKEISGLFGRTVLYPINQRLGFEVHEIRSFWMKLFLKIWDNLIKVAFSKPKKGKFIVREPKEVWISKEALIKKACKKK